MNEIEIAAAATLSAVCLALAWNDLRRYLLPDPLTLALAVSGLLFAFLLNRDGITDHAVGLIAGFASFALIARLYRGIRGREGLGGGDAKLMAGAGAWVGWQGLPSTVLIGTIAALSVTLLAAKVRGHDLSAETPVPLGVFLAFGLWVTWLFGSVSF